MTSRLPAVVLAALVLTAAAMAVVMTARYPAMFDDPNAGVWLSSRTQDAGPQAPC